MLDQAVVHLALNGAHAHPKVGGNGLVGEVDIHHPQGAADPAIASVGVQVCFR
ncbi:MAG: hypothetical protein J2P17_08385 [Mycobacterium sp.]|nr:hypothetical protein [Mycobacterium sp.]